MKVPRDGGKRTVNTLCEDHHYLIWWSIDSTSWKVIEAWRKSRSQAE